MPLVIFCIGVIAYKKQLLVEVVERLEVGIVDNLFYPRAQLFSPFYVF